MIALFLDTATSNLVIGIVKDNKIIYECQKQMVREHSSYALPEIEKSFLETKLNPSDIDKIMVVVGPGSYTGVRIGVTIAKTYAWALRKELVGITSLKAMSLVSDDYDFIVPMIDARCENVFASIYDKNGNIVLKEQHISIEELKREITKLRGKVLLKGFNISEYFDNVIDYKLDILKIVNYLKDEKGVNPHELNPLYLNKPEVLK